MTLDIERIANKFDDVEFKIEEMIEFCQTLQAEKVQMLSRINELEAEVKAKQEIEKNISEQDVLIQSKIDGLLTKLEDFTQKNLSGH